MCFMASNKLFPACRKFFSFIRSHTVTQTIKISFYIFLLLFYLIFIMILSFISIVIIYALYFHSWVYYNRNFLCIYIISNMLFFKSCHYILLYASHKYFCLTYMGKVKNNIKMTCLSVCYWDFNKQLIFFRMFKLWIEKANNYILHTWI